MKNNNQTLLLVTIMTWIMISIVQILLYNKVLSYLGYEIQIIEKRKGYNIQTIYVDENKDYEVTHLKKGEKTIFSLKYDKITKEINQWGEEAYFDKIKTFFVHKLRAKNLVCTRQQKSGHYVQFVLVPNHTKAVCFSFDLKFDTKLFVRQLIFWKYIEPENII